MSYQGQNQRKDETESDTKKSLPLIRKPVSAKMIPGSANIFDSRDLEYRSTSFDISAPGNGVSTNMLSIQNPGLLAFRNKADHIRTKEFVRPESNFTPKPITSTLLSRRPLGKLRDPTDIPALETVQHLIETEKASLAFNEDPVAYFSKRKDGRGHLFIYLVYAGDRKDPRFSPYELKKVTSADIKSGTDYFTMSATGVTLVQADGNTEHVTLDQWAKASASFIALRKLKFFDQYFFWKPFRIWKKFVLQSRFRSLQDSICLYPFFKNVNFFGEFMKKMPETEEQMNDSKNYSNLSFVNLRETSESLLKKYLLSSFQSAKKYPIDEFEKQTKSNIENLKKEYADFISSIQDTILVLYEVVSDPTLVQVNDSEFPEIRRRNPNLGQMMILEKKKAAARRDKTKDVNREIESIGSYIRMIDYILLESLTHSCISCWKTTELNVSDSTQAHTIFQVEVLFNEEGKVIFQPILDDLLKTISWALNLSIETLNSLPRLAFATNLRPLLRDNGLDMGKLYNDGPQFSTIINQGNALDKIRSNIEDSIKSAYEVALRVSQSYTKFYPIYKLGQKWDPRDYIITRKGEKFQGSLQSPPGEGDDSFLLNHMDEPVVDFDRVENDIQRFRKDEEKVKSSKSLASGQSKMALYIDTKNIREKLIPIPTTAHTDLNQILNDLVEYKNVKISSALKFYDKRLKQVPRQLDNFVEFCVILQRTIEVTPQIKAELDFVDRMMMLFDKFDISGPTTNQTTMFNSFESAKKQAQLLREQSLEEFIGKLKGAVQETERRIDHFYEKATTVPGSMKDADIDSKLPSAKKLCVKVEQMAPDIAKIVKYQEVIGVELNNFSAFKDVLAAAKFAVRLYTAVSQWQNISKQMTSTPFQRIQIDDFKKELETLKEVVSDLQTTAKTNYPILNELVTKVNEIYPFLDELELLSKGKMQVRHWNTLFEECQQQNAYSTNTTIEELLSFGILKMRDKIESITATSHGESELEVKFQQISNHWNKVQIPLVDQQVKTDDTVLLGSTDKLIEQIFDTLATLQNMLVLPFVQGVRDAVTSLSSTLENVTQILDAWRIFQNNWIVLSALFNLEEARTILPHQANRFATVQRKWVSIVRNTMKDTRLFSVCAFPSLLDILHENNKSMESILTALGKYLDTKRAALPRLYFLSNDEVLTLSSTNNFAQFARNIPKIFMHIRDFDYKDVDKSEREVASGNQGLSRMKVLGMIGENGDILQFQKHVSCNGPLETWLAQLIESMRNTVRDSIIQSIPGCTNGNFLDWIYSIPIYISSTSLNVIFTTEMEECFTKIEKNSKAFSIYEKTLTTRINDIMNTITDKSIEPNKFSKLSFILTQLFSFRDTFKKISEKNSDTSRKFTWKNTLKYKFVSNQLTVYFDEFSFEHGYEFWGILPRLIHTPALDSTVNSFISALANSHVPVLAGSDSSGRLTVIRNHACQLGRFLFVARPFPDISEFFMSRILIGASSSGSWVVFTNIDKLSHNCLSYLFDNIRAMNVAQTAGNPRITISSRLTDLNKFSRVLITSHYLKEKMPEFPPQLRSFIRPTVLLKPDYNRYTEIKLQSLGFKDAKLIAPKLTSSAHTISHFFSNFRSNSVLCHISIICEKSEGNSRIYQSVFPDEISLVAFTLFQYCKMSLTEVESNVLLEFIYSGFKIKDTFEEFSNAMNSFLDTDINNALSKVVDDQIKQQNIELPIDYIIGQTLALYHMLTNNICVVISGPSYSGKSTIIKMLAKCLENEDVQKAKPLLKPFVIKSLYHASDDKKNIFGCVTNDLSLGQIWSYGQIQAVLNNLLSVKKEYQPVLLLNGPMTSDYVEFLYQFLGPPSSNSCQLNSLDSYPTNSGLKVIVETDSLAHFTPGLLSRCDLLFMKNVQTVSRIPLPHPIFKLVRPSLALSRAIEVVKEGNPQFNLSEDNMSRFGSHFVTIAPTIVNYVYNVENKICYIKSNRQIQHGEILFTETYPTCAAILSLVSIEASKIDFDDEKQIKTLIAFCFYRIFSCFLNETETNSLDTWLRSTYSIEIPTDWVGNSVPDHFWEVYPRPSIASLRLYKGKLIPIDFSLISGKPLIITRSENMNPIVQEDMMIAHAQMLPSFHECRSLLNNKINFIIQGDHESGKSSFVSLLFNNYESIIPVIIPSSEFHSQETVLPLISAHTNLITKIKLPASQIRTFAFVFDNLEASHIYLIEFIRMLVSEHQIPVYSKGDQKIYEMQSINNFMVIVTTREYEKLPVRFISMFMPIYLPTLSIPTASFISRRIMVTYGNEQPLSKELIKMIAQILEQFQPTNTVTTLIKTIYIYCHTREKDNRIENLKIMLGQIYYYSLHRSKQDDFRDKFSFLVKGFLETDAEMETVDRFLEFNTIFYPTFSLSKDLKNYEISADFLTIRQLKDELHSALNTYNLNSNEKIALRLSKHVLFQIALIHTCLNCPGKNLILKGKSGSGRYTITRFVTNLLESDFVNIGPPSSDEELAKDERLTVFNNLLRDVITNATVHQKRTIIFIRSNSTKSTEKNLLVNLVEKRDFATFFTKAGLDDLYSRFTGLHSLTYEQRLVAFRQIRSIIRMNIHIVIAQDLDDETVYQSSRFDQILLESDYPDIFRMTALDVYEGLASRKLIQSIKNNIPDLFYRLSEIARSKMPYFHVNMYYDFVDTFAHFAAADYQDALSLNENIQSALEFLSRLESESHQIEKKLNSLAPTLQRLQVDSETLLSSYTTRKEAIETRRAKLDEEHREKAEEVAILEDKVLELQHEVEEKAPRIEITQKIVEDLNDNDIETIRITASDPMPSLRLLLEIFCLILDKPADYERAGQNLLMDPKFIETVVARVSKMTMTPQLLSSIEPYFEMEALNPDELESIAPSLKSLFDWIESVCKVAITREKHSKMKKELEDKQRQLNEYVEEMNLEKSSIEQVEASLENENKALAASTEAREEMEKEYHVVDARKKSIDLIFKGIEHFTQKWQDESSNYTSKKEKLMGDCILFAFYLVFCGSMDIESKKQALDTAIAEMRIANIDTNFDNPMKSIADKFLSSSTEDFYSRTDLLFSMNTVIDAHHVRSTSRTPLLIDPDGIVKNYIIASIKPKRLVVVSQNLSTLDSVLASAVCDGKTLILLDCDYLHPLIAPLLPLDLFNLEQNAVKDIRINTKLTTWDPRFKLILVSSTTSISNLPDELLSRVSIINVSSSSLETTNLFFSNTFIDFFNPSLTPKILNKHRVELSQNVQIQKYERDTLDILSDIVATQQTNPDYDYLTDEETIADLLRSKDCYFKLLNQETDFSSLNEEVKTALQPFRNHIRLCQTFWTIMSRVLPTVSKNAHFTFQSYQKNITAVFVNEGMHAGTLTAEQHSALHSALITATFQFIFQSIPINECFFFLFVTTFRLREFDEKLTSTDFKAILNHITKEYNEGTENKQNEKESESALDNLKYSNISHLFNNLSQFISDHFGSDFTSFLQHFQADSIISNTATVPTIIVAKPLVDPTPLVHLFITMRCRHENFDAISLSDDLEVIRNVRKMLVTALNRGNWVLIHYSKPNRSAADMLVDVFTQMTTTSVNTNFRLIILCSTIKYLSPLMISKSKRINVDTFPSIRNTMLSAYHHHNSCVKSTLNSKAMKKISYACAILIASLNYRSFVQPFGFNYKIYTQDMIFREFVENIRSILDARVNEENQEEANNNNNNTITNTTSATTTNTTNTANINNSSSTASNTNSSNAKSNNSGNTKSNNNDDNNGGNNNSNNDGTGNAAVDEISFVNIRLMIEHLFYSSVFDKFDRRKIHAQIHTLFNNDILEDGFSPCQDSDESEKLWTFPSGDVPVSNYAQTISQISLTPSTQILQMNQEMSMPILNWNLSRWISKPFIKYNKKNNIVKIDPQAAQLKVDNFAILLPEKVVIENDEGFESINGLILLNEINRLNGIVSYLRNELSIITSHLKNGIVTKEAYLVARGIVPKAWKLYSGYYSTSVTNKFATQFIQKHTELLKWMKNDTAPRVFDVRIFDDIQNIISCFLAQQAKKNNCTIDSLALTFSIVDYTPIEKESRPSSASEKSETEKGEEEEEEKQETPESNTTEENENPENNNNNAEQNADSNEANPTQNNENDANKETTETNNETTKANNESTETNKESAETNNEKTETNTESTESRPNTDKPKSPEQKEGEKNESDNNENKEDNEEEEEAGSKLSSSSSSAKSSSPKVLEPSEDEIILTGLTLICGGVTNGILSLRSSLKKDTVKTFTPNISLLIRTISKEVLRNQQNQEKQEKQEKEEDKENHETQPPLKRFRCPLYKSALFEGLNKSEKQVEPIEGVSSNFIWEVELQSDQTEKSWTEYGTALVCRMPEQFT